LSRQTQNRWKFAIANVRGGGFANCDVILEGGVKYLWRNVTRGGGGRFLPKIVWRHLWTAPVSNTRIHSTLQVEIYEQYVGYCNSPKCNCNLFHKLLCHILCYSMCSIMNWGNHSHINGIQSSQSVATLYWSHPLPILGYIFRTEVESLYYTTV